MRMRMRGGEDEGRERTRHVGEKATCALPGARQASGCHEVKPWATRMHAPHARTCKVGGAALKKGQSI